MNKKQRTEACREILYKYNIDDIIDAYDKSFMINIFEGHSEWDIKKGVGILSISIMNNTFNRCFRINRIDGSSTDISFTHCINKPSKLSFVKKACRSAIRNEIVLYRNNNVFFGVSKCPFTNEVLEKENTHIDHYDLTFDQMFNFWIINKDIEKLYLKINKTIDNCVDTYFTDKYLVNDFIDFHNKSCKLRAVSKKANLSILKSRLT